MRYSVQGKSHNGGWFELYETDDAANARIVADSPLHEMYYSEVIVVDTDEEAIPEFLYET